MKVLLRRDQKSGMLSSAITFTLDARAELNPEEQTSIKKYKMGKVMLYERSKMIDPGSGLLGLASRFAHRMLNLSITIDDLVGGKHIECKDVLELLAVEEQIKEACQTFKAILDAAAHFGGEEIVEM